VKGDTQGHSSVALRQKFLSTTVKCFFIDVFERFPPLSVRARTLWLEFGSGLEFGTKSISGVGQGLGFLFWIGG